VVYADDHRGHGKTAGDLSKAGIAGEDGWNGMINDEKQLSELIKKENAGLPLFLFGHSMGSFLAQGYIERWGSELKGAVLSGSTGLAIFPPEVIPFLEQAAAGEARDKFPEAAGALLSPFNEPFKPARTPFDWLSRDEAEVQKYVDDPWCGFDFSHGLTLDMARGMVDMLDQQNQALIPKDLPVLIVSGELDPVGMNNGVRALEQRYKELGMKEVKVILYPECRHEILNETNRNEVHRDVTRWLDEHVG
jgi:alpha-beta hydrolase superfamily lysophospholipase